MLGFIKKDLLMIKGNFKILGILLIIYTVLAFQGEMDLSFLLPFMSVMVMMSTFSYDSYNKWDSYAIAIPNGRKNSVRGKYLSTLLLIFLTAVVITILSFIISYVRTKTIDYELISLFGCVVATILLQSFMYPAIYKFGLEKARIGIFIVVFGFVIIGSFLEKYIDLSALTTTFSFLKDYLIIIVSIIVILILYISYKISERIYRKKEF